MSDQPKPTEGFPYFWLGREAESIPTPWRTAWLARPVAATGEGGIECVPLDELYVDLRR